MNSQDIINEVKKSFKPLGMRGKYYNLTKVLIVEDKIFCHIQSRLNSELYVDCGADMKTENGYINFIPFNTQKYYRLYNNHEANMVISQNDLKIFVDMSKYVIDMLKSTIVKVKE